jgi:hypothetical protein
MKGGSGLSFRDFFLENKRPDKAIKRRPLKTITEP